MKEHFQNLYNGYIRLSDTCLKNSEITHGQLKELWAEKAKQYKYCSEMLNATCLLSGIILQKETTLITS